MRTRRMRLSGRGAMESPEEEVDFHSFRPGVTRREIEEFTHEVIQDLKVRHISRVRFIIGKGLHSKQGPVVPPIVLELLEELKRDSSIREFFFERTPNGTTNQGAVIIVL